MDAQGGGGNPNTPPEALKRLAGDEHEEVRAAVAGNSNAPIRLLRHLVKDENKYVREHAKWVMFAIAKRYCLNIRSQYPLTDADRNPMNVACDMNLTCEDLALWVAGTPPHETTVALPVYLLNREELLGAIVWLCREPLPSLEEAQSHDLYARSAAYRAAVAALYLPTMTWFDTQMHMSHLLRPIYLQRNLNGADNAAYPLHVGITRGI